jgi:hypothetical protein
LANGPKKNISIQFGQGFIPKNVSEVISGKSLPFIEKDNEYTINLDGFDVMAGFEVDL